MKKIYIMIAFIFIAVFFLYLWNIERHYREKAKKIDRDINHLVEETIEDNLDKINAIIWSSQNVSKYCSSLKGLVDANFNENLDIKVKIKNNLITETRLQLYQDYLSYKLLINIIRNLRDKILEDPSFPMLYAAIEKLARDRNIKYKDSNSIFIDQKMTQTTQEVLESKGFLAKRLWDDQNFRSDIKNAHIKAFENHIRDLLTNESNQWRMSKKVHFLSVFRGKFNEKEAIINDFLKLSQEKITKYKVGAIITEYTNSFLRNKVSTNNVKDYRSSFHGPIDAVKMYVNKKGGEKRFKKYAQDIMKKNLFKPNEFIDLIEGISTQVTRIVRSGINDYIVLLPENLNLNINSQTRINKMSLNDIDTLELPSENKVLINSAIDTLDVGVVGAQVLILTGIASAPATGGASLVLTIAGLSWDVALIVKDFIINPRMESYEVATLKDSIQNNLYTTLVANKKNTRSMTALYFDIIENKFENLP